ncbi:MAG: radical SAM protein [Candidatus Lokiarchaeota archaeon]|nr:radical SAM protein [Candidatus Lokiarchaeota archaeon]
MSEKKSRSLIGVLREIDQNMPRIVLPWLLRHPRYLFAAPRLLHAFTRSERLQRANLESTGLVVPPFLILSVTNACNLHCAGCYARIAGTLDPRSRGEQMGIYGWRSVLAEAQELGVWGVIMAGGEPFMLDGLLALCKEFPLLFFVIFSNGTAIRDVHYELMRRLSNVAVILSIEGDASMTDSRRGRGVHGRVLHALRRLNKAGVLTGISVTITTENHAYWMDPGHVDELIEDGVRLAFFMEFIPPGPGHPLLLSVEQRAGFREKILEYRRTRRLILVHSPGDEELMGGCVSAGRGFAHVTPSGDLTPCPVSDVATHNVKRSSLREGLASDLFKRIREDEHLLEVDGAPCALFAHPEAVDQLAREVGAYRTTRA